MNYIDFPRQRVRLVLPRYAKYNKNNKRRKIALKKIATAKKAVRTKKTLSNKKTTAKKAVSAAHLSANVKHKTIKTKYLSANKKHKVIKTKRLVQKKQYLLVVVDPGHGGRDPGATGPDNTHEKTVVLQISQRLKKMINAVPGFAAVLTRNGDYYLRLRQRLAIARKKNARMFVAIHADAFNDHSAHGVSVFALSLRGATSEAARWLAHNENRSEYLGEVSLHNKSKTLRSVLLDLAQNATINTSIKIGRQIIANVKTYAHLHQRHVEQAAFVVLKSPDIPSLLVEAGFLSNPAEEIRLKSPHYQKMVATSISQGIIQYFISHPPQGTKLKFWKSQGKTLYKIKKHDNFKRIALHFHTTTRIIKQLNKTKLNALKVGSYIFVPTSK